jgi:UDPglucose 6-dehydrogenase
VRVYDPQGRSQAEPLLQGVEWGKDAMDAVNGADATVVLTEWSEFRALELSGLKASMRGDVLVDLRNMYRPDLARAAGLRYTSIGR